VETKRWKEGWTDILTWVNTCNANCGSIKTTIEKLTFNKNISMVVLAVSLAPFTIISFLIEEYTSHVISLQGL
jgi:hypothetical protein